MMKLDDYHSEVPGKLMDLSSEHQWLPRHKWGGNQAMCPLMKEHTITYSLAKGIEHRLPGCQFGENTKVRGLC